MSGFFRDVMSSLATGFVDEFAREAGGGWFLRLWRSVRCPDDLAIVPHWNLQGECHRRWRRILSRAKAPQRFYISAGDLWFMGPFLSDLRAHPSVPDLGTMISGICLKAIPPSISEATINGKRVFADGFQDRLEGQVRALQKAWGQDFVKKSEWGTLPPFHGCVYGDYLIFGGWALDEQGTLGVKTFQTLFHRGMAPDLFDRYAGQLKAGFASG